MKPKFLILIPMLFLLLLPIAKCDIVANSYNWRDVYTVMLYSQYLGKQFHFVNNLGEAKILSMTLNRSKYHTIFESNRNSVVKNLEKFLELRGFDKLSSERFDSYNTLQFDLYKRVKEKVKGFIVINDKFGYDAISVMPYALKNNYWVFFYNKQTADEIIRTINSNPSKPVIFYGEFLQRPWIGIKNSYKIIDEKSFFSNNIKVLGMYLNQTDDPSKIWLVASNGQYLGEGYLVEKMPIIFTEEDAKEILKIMSDYGVKLVEVIGPENVLFGQEIRDLSNKTVGVVVRAGRTFTGNPELRGKEYVLRQLPVDEPYAKLEIEKIYYDKNSGKMIIVLKNEGNINSEYYLSGIGVFYGNREKFPEFNSETHVIPDGVTIGLPIRLNLTKPPDKAEVLILYGYELPLKETLQKTFNVTTISLNDSSSVKLVTVYYDYYKKGVYVEIKNVGKNDAYSYVEIYNFDVLGLNRTLFFGPVKLAPGEKKVLSFDVYLNKTDIKKNSDLNISLFYGKSLELMPKQDNYTVSIKVRKSFITGLIVAAKSNVTYVLIAIIVISLAVIVLVSRKKNRAIKEKTKTKNKKSRKKKAKKK